MDFSFFVGKKIATQSGNSFTRLIIRLAVLGVGLSLAVMILAVGIVKGFQLTIKNKVVGFDGHIQIRHLDLNQSKELQLISINQPFLDTLETHSDITYVSPFCTKAGIINATQEIEGMVFKGVSADYNWAFLESGLSAGRLPVLNDTSDTYEVVLSDLVASKLDLVPEDFMEVYFIHEGKVRRRRLKVTGLYNTGLGEFDKTVCFTDIRVIQRLYGTDYADVSGFEVGIADLDRLDAVSEWIDAQIGFKLRAVPVSEIHDVIFKWLRIVDSNALIIVVLMTMVALINLITAFLILIIDRTQMVGTLKSLGATNAQVVNVFLVKGLGIILPGLVIGNLLGLGLAWAQTRFEIITLPVETYYMSVMPVQIDVLDVVLLNAGTFIICTAVMFIPAIMVRFISPVRALRFA